MRDGRGVDHAQGDTARATLGRRKDTTRPFVFAELGSERVVRGRWDADAAYVLGVGRSARDRKRVGVGDRVGCRGVAAIRLGAARRSYEPQRAGAAKQAMEERGADQSTMRIRRPFSKV